MALFRKILVIAAFLPALASAQGLQLGFGQNSQNTGLPVEVTSETLSVNQSDGSAIFEGNVDVTQGDMRLTADKVDVFYKEDSQGIDHMIATGDVLLVQGPDVAEGDHAVYTIESGDVVMTGNVTVLRETTTISGDKLVMNLQTNTAQVTGNVKTVLRSQ